MILATLLVSSQVLVAAPLAFAEESTSSEGRSAISQTIETRLRQLQRQQAQKLRLLRRIVKKNCRSMR